MLNAKKGNSKVYYSTTRKILFFFTWVTCQILIRYSQPPCTSFKGEISLKGYEVFYSKFKFVIYHDIKELPHCELHCQTWQFNYVSNSNNNKKRILSKRNHAKAKKWYYSVFLAIFRGMLLTNKLKCALTYSKLSSDSASGREILRLKRTKKPKVKKHDVLNEKDGDFMRTSSLIGLMIIAPSI